MEVKSGYKQTEVGIVPDDWAVVPMGSLGAFSKGKGIRKDEAASGDIPCVRYGELYTEHNDIIRSFNSRISAQVARSSKQLKTGDILFAGSGETKDEIGKCAAFLGDETAYAGGDIVILSPADAAPGFLGYLFNGAAVARQKARRGQGDAIVHISSSALSSILIPLPPTTGEQQAIAGALNDADALIESLEQLLAKERELKHGTMQALLTGQRRLPGFSGACSTITLGEAADIRNGATPSTRVASYWNGSIPWCTPTDITGTPGKYLLTTERSITAEGLASCAASILPTGALLLCTRATLGDVKIATSPICTNQGFKALVCRDGVSNEFLYYLLLTLKPRLIERAIGSTFLEVGKRDVAAIAIRLPRPEEQQAIASVLSDVDAEISTLEVKVAKVRQLKLGMMQELLTGRIRLA